MQTNWDYHHRASRTSLASGATRDFRFDFYTLHSASADSELFHGMFVYVFFWYYLIYGSSSFAFAFRHSQNNKTVTWGLRSPARASLLQKKHPAACPPPSVHRELSGREGGRGFIPRQVQVPCKSSSRLPDRPLYREILGREGGGVFITLPRKRSLRLPAPLPPRVLLGREGGHFEQD